MFFLPTIILSCALSLSALGGFEWAYRYMHERANLDLKIAQSGEQLCDTLFEIQKLNRQLLSLYARCPAAALPPVMAELQAEGQAIVIAQKVLDMRVSAGLALWDSDIDARVMELDAYRLPPGPCSLPGLYQRVEIFARFENKIGGFSLKWGQMPSWRYENPRVGAL